MFVVVRHIVIAKRIKYVLVKKLLLVHVTNNVLL